METHEFFARCASGFESLLADELRKLKIKRIRPLKGGVAFFSDYPGAYRACLWSRVASRVLLVIARIPADDADSLYQGVRGIDWAAHILPSSTISVYAHGTNENLRNTQFIAMKTKDAVCDRLRGAYGSRPDVRASRPDVVLDTAIRGQRATVSIDFSGESLHRRGYRAEGIQSAAPLKESLAAAIVLASGWEDLARSGAPFIDPLCGSGTLAIEAAMIAADRAPGLTRDYWGFTGWAGFDAPIWTGLVDEADEAFARASAAMPPIIASDNDASAVGMGEANARRAGLSDAISFAVRGIADLEVPSGGLGPGLIVTNPPYGERMGSGESLERLYGDMARGFDRLPDGWRIAVISSDDAVDVKLGMPPVGKSSFYNGRIETELRQFAVDRGSQVVLDVMALPTGETSPVKVLEQNSGQFAARFRKVAKERRKWAERNGISCYRIYDADLPDYAVAVDFYRGESGRGHDEACLVVSEYNPPKNIDADRARRRFSDALALAAAIEGIPPDRVFPKERRREKGGGQYREAGGRHFVTHTREAGFLFEVDLGGYLDTGLFLDHRKTRGIVGGMAEGKRFLNLFAYTGTATVYAAGGRALGTTTVDLSNTYLEWAKRNMASNGFTGGCHRFIRADVLDWIDREAGTGNRYDLVFVDPPTFSNSKSMGKGTWSVERDHIGLLAKVSKLLAPGGTIVFSCNLRNFKPAGIDLERCGLGLTDITAETIPEDFKRNPKIHHCFLVTVSQGVD